MNPDTVSIVVGIAGMVVLFAVLARLSARMGEGMHIPGYYYLYYLSMLASLAAAAGIALYPDAYYYVLLVLSIGNCLTIAASYKYWWWLREELVG